MSDVLEGMAPGMLGKFWWLVDGVPLQPFTVGYIRRGGNFVHEDSVGIPVFAQPVVAHHAEPVHGRGRVQNHPSALKQRCLLLQREVGLGEGRVHGAPGM